MKNKTLNLDNITKEQRKTILFTIMMGAFLTALNQTVLTAALPSIMNDFNVNANTGQWLTTIYMLVLGVMIPATPYLINRFSTRKLFMSAMIFFFLGCILSITSINFGMMIASRILQAICGGITMQLVQILMMRMYPVEERGTAMGIYGLVVGVAPAIGPTLSGAIIDYLNWKALFYILDTIALIDVVLALIFLKNVGETKNDKLDVISLALSTLGFGGILTGVSNQGNYGWNSYLTYLPLIIGLVSLLLFTIRQLKLEEPLLNLKIFKSRNFSISVILLVIINAAMTSSTMLIALYIQSMRGYSALTSGLLMLPGSIFLSVFNPIAGKLFDKHGSRKVAIPGLVMLGVGTLGFSFLREGTLLIYLTIMYAIRMVGISFSLMPVTTWGINSLQTKEIASGSAVGSTLRQIAGTIGSAVLISMMSNVAVKNSSIMSEALANIKGLNYSFIVSAAIIFIGLTLSIIFMKDIKEKESEENPMKLCS